MKHFLYDCFVLGFYLIIADVIKRLAHATGAVGIAITKVELTAYSIHIDRLPEGYEKRFLRQNFRRHARKKMQRTAFILLMRNGGWYDMKANYLNQPEVKHSKLYN
jgi:hypothetical protein